VSEPPAVVRVTRSLSLPADELRWRFTTSSGPGGQHANRSHTAVEVSFDIGDSPSLGPRQRARLLERLGPVVTARSSDERSQVRNREKALDRLRQKLADALVVTRPRRATAPSAAARRRRLDDKKRRGELKRERRADPFA
jgi:ribosome-associated protein